MIVIWIAFAAIFATIFIVAKVADKKRTDQVRQLAGDMGLAHRDQLEGEDQSAFSLMPLANRGRHRRTSNVIVADSGELRMVIFDYRFTTGGGKNKTTHRQTVVLAQSNDLQVPQFSLSPESFFHRIADFFGMKDIDFEEDKVFSEKFLLHGSEEASVRDFFSESRRRKLMDYVDACIEADGQHFIFYRRRKRLDTEELKGLMAQAFAIRDILKATD